MYQIVAGSTLALFLIACGRLGYDPAHQCIYPPPGDCAPENLQSAVGMAVASGTTTGVSNVQPSCEAGEAPEAAFMWTAPSTGVFTFDTRGSAFDTVLHSRLGTCGGPEMACNDDIDGNDYSSILQVAMGRGDRIVFFVDGFEPGEEGDFVLNILASEQTLCGDGIDNDGDGETDCDDLDCAEDWQCAEAGRCNDERDNDGDALADCADPDCACDRGCADACDATLLTGLGQGLAQFDHAGACSRLLESSCMSRSQPKRTFRWVPESNGRYRIDTFGSGDVTTSLSVHVGSCSGPELGCNHRWEESDDAAVILDLRAGQEVFIVVGSRDGLVDNVSLNIERTEEGTCLDGMDNDNDGATDCADSDCANRWICSEVGRCDDMQDNDQDGDTDCADSDCSGDAFCAGSPVPGCPDFTLGGLLGQGIGLGATVGVGNDVEGTCTDTAGPELSYLWTAPSTSMFSFSLANSSYDTVIHVRLGSCTGPELGCADNNGDRVDTYLEQGQSVVIFADSHSDGAGDVVVNVERSEKGSCIDTVDNDGDGMTDCLDPDCEDEDVCGEVDRCTDGIDNDGDDDVDCDDSECTCDPACFQSQCPGTDLGTAVGPAVATGDTSEGPECGQLEASCKDTVAPERTFAWRAPASATYTFDTIGSELSNVLYMLPPTCEGLDLACERTDGDDPAVIEMFVEKDAEMVIVVDGQHDATGAFVLNITQSEVGMCGNGRDDDSDGAADCSDPDCADSLFCCEGEACVCQPPESEGVDVPGGSGA